tara:strand:- start:108 stop:275 length:168 start_codon:yes stop_codon:yes gene_type:complete
MINAAELMNAQDLVNDLADIAGTVRFEMHEDLVADEIDRAVKEVANLVERLRPQV